MDKGKLENNVQKAGLINDNALAFLNASCSLDLCISMISDSIVEERTFLYWFK